MDKKKGIIVLLIAVVAVWFLFFRGGDTCTMECADEATCELSEVVGCAGAPEVTTEETTEETPEEVTTEEVTTEEVTTEEVTEVVTEEVTTE